MRIDYKQLSKMEFLPGLEALDLGSKANVIQSLLEENFFHDSGLFYSLLLISGPREIRSTSRADLEGASVIEGVYKDGGASDEAAREEGMTFENSIYSAGLYLQSQVARYAVTKEPAAMKEALRALNALRMIYDYARERGHEGWLGKPYGQIPKDHSSPDQYHAAIIGLYQFHEIARPAERLQIVAMLRGIADFMTKRNYQIWDVSKPTDALPWNIGFAYCNTTYVLAQAMVFRLTGEMRYRDEALRLADLARWREWSHLDEWAADGLTRVLEFERVAIGSFVLHAVEMLAEILPELFGATHSAVREGLARALEKWWAFTELGIDNNGYQHYWIDIDVTNRTWKPTGIRECPRPSMPGTFWNYYSDVRWSDQLYRRVTAAFPVIAHLPNKRESALAWMRDMMERTNGERMRWVIDLDGHQLKPDVKWMGCMLSSEAPFHYLITYWRGRALGYWA